MISDDRRSDRRPLALLGGIVVIAFALISYFQYDTLIVAWLTAFYPQGQIGL